MPFTVAVHCAVTLIAIEEGVQAAETDVMLDETGGGGVSLLPPPQETSGSSSSDIPKA